MRKPILITLIAAAFSDAGSAAILASYDFEATGGALASKAVVAGLTASAFSFGAQAATGNSFSTNTPVGSGAQSLNLSGAGIAITPTTTPAGFPVAKTDGTYLYFTLTPEAGTSLNLTSITFDKGRLSGGTNGSSRILVTSSLSDEYADRLPLTDSATSIADVLEANQTGEISIITTGTNASWGATGNVVVDLAGLQFQNVTEPITFKIYAFGVNNGSGSLFFDNFIVNGTLIPEPSSLMLGLLGLAPLLRRKR